MLEKHSGVYTISGEKIYLLKIPFLNVDAFGFFFSSIPPPLPFLSLRYPSADVLLINIKRHLPLLWS